MSKPTATTEKTTDGISVAPLPAGCLGTLVCIPGKPPCVLQHVSEQSLSLALPGVAVWPHEERFTSLHHSTSVLVEVLGRRYIVCPCRIMSLDPQPDPDPEPEPEPQPEVPPQYSPKTDDVIRHGTTIEKTVTIRRKKKNSISSRMWQLSIGKQAVGDCTHIVITSDQPKVHVGDEIIGVRPKRMSPCAAVPFVDCSTRTHEELCQMMQDAPGRVQLRIRRKQA